MDPKTLIDIEVQWMPAAETVYVVAKEDLVEGDWDQWDPKVSTQIGDVAAHNAQVIQKMLDRAGEAGGGRVILPEGIYCLKGDTTKFCSYCLTIRYDNVALIGQGADPETGRYRTVLKTAHQWDGPNGVYRCSGILIQGTDFNAPVPRQNIMIAGFEMEGGRGWSGVYDWGYDPAVDYGWDIGHKGITVSHDKKVTHVLLKDLYVHRYSGETVYVGGLLVGYIQMEDCVLSDTNASCFNLYAKYLFVRRCQFGTPDTKCRFWIEHCARRSYITYEMPPLPFELESDCAVFVGNRFYNSVGAHGVAIAQGDNSRFAYLFAHNQFDNAECKAFFGIFQFAGGVAGPAEIVDNVINNCKGSILTFDYGGGTEPPNNLLNKNIILKRNRCENIGSPVIHLLGTWGYWDDKLQKTLPKQQPIENIVAEDNDFSGYDPAGFSMMIGSYYRDITSAVCLKNIVIRNNRFSRCRPPMERDEFVGRLPLFEGNTYADYSEICVMLEGGNDLLCPVYETMTVYADEPVNIRMRTEKNPDGQRVVIIGAAETAPIRFSAKGEGYVIPGDRVISAGESITFRYHEDGECWVCED